MISFFTHIAPSRCTVLPPGHEADSKGTFGFCPANCARNNILASKTATHLSSTCAKKINYTGYFVAVGMLASQRMGVKSKLTNFTWACQFLIRLLSASNEMCPKFARRDEPSSQHEGTAGSHRARLALTFFFPSFIYPTIVHIICTHMHNVCS